MINKVVLCTGGFDPLHSGHIEYLRDAKSLGNILIVGVNSDAWLTRKKGRAFMPGPERVAILENLKFVDHCILFNDDDDTAIEAIHNAKDLYPNSQIIFANGGDRTRDNIPEMKVKDVEFAFGIGGENKKNSILTNTKLNYTQSNQSNLQIKHITKPLFMNYLFRKILKN